MADARPVYVTWCRACCVAQYYFNSDPVLSCSNPDHPQDRVKAVEIYGAGTWAGAEAELLRSEERWIDQNYDLEEAWGRKAKLKRRVQRAGKAHRQIP